MRFLSFKITVKITPAKAKTDGKSSKKEKKPAEDDKDWVLVPPDGGWGWLVLAGSMLVNLLVPGTIKSFGVLFVEFLDAFQASQLAAAWIPALCYFLYSSLGIYSPNGRPTKRSLIYLQDHCLAFYQ